MRPLALLRVPLSVTWSHVTPVHGGLIDEVLMLKGRSDCRVSRHRCQLGPQGEGGGGWFTLRSQSPANGHYDMKTHLGRDGKGEGRASRQAELCNLIVPSPEETGHNALEYLLFIQRPETTQSSPFSPRMWRGVWFWKVTFTGEASTLKNEVLKSHPHSL